MATGASNADAIVLLVDVTKGLQPQTRRHLAIARLLGIEQAIAFVNKMDLVGYAEEAFRKLELHGLEAIPGSALRGDMVVERAERLRWYKGPTLLERLESLDSSAERAASGPLRFPVQLVSRPSTGAPRGYMGRLESGHLLAGTEVIVLPSGRRTRVRHILAHGTERELAVAGDSVTLVLGDDIDLARGDLIVDPAMPPSESRSLTVTLVWLGDEPLRSGGRYLVHQAARRALARVVAEGEVRLNDIARATLSLYAPLFVDPYDAVRATGSFILIDEATNHTVAAGLVQ